MASVSTDQDGNRTVQFKGIDGKRKTIWLGKTPAKAASSIASMVEAILLHKITGYQLESNTANWLASRPPKMMKKLVAVGLAEPVKPSEPAEVETVAMVGTFLDGYLERRVNDIKSGTHVSYGHTVRNLKTVFGESKPLAEINPGDADDFRRHLQQVEKLSSATIVRRCTVARTFFKDAVRRRLIDSNPFDGVGKGSTANPDRQRFIDHETIYKVIDACPNAEWRLLVALSRFGGLRVPSEPLLLRWQDVDTVEWKKMLVHSPKTEHHVGKGMRMVPIFPELLEYFKDAFKLAEDGAEWVLPSLRKPGITSGDWRNVNFGTMFIKIIKRAHLVPWPRVWHNLRSSRQTELTEIFPSHVVSAWLGNSEKIAEKHYLQVLDSHFQQAIEKRAGEKPVQKPVQTTPAIARNTTNNGHDEAVEVMRKTPETHGSPQESGVKSDSDEWVMRDSNPRHPRCKHGALTS